MTLDDLLAREAIRQTLTNYTMGADVRDVALFNAQWTAEAIFEFDGFPPVPSFRCEGLADIQAHTARWAAPKDPSLRHASFARHNLTSSSIELDAPDRARARTFFVVITDIGPDHAGVYEDRLVKQGDQWLFTHRRITLDWRSDDSIFPALKKG